MLETPNLETPNPETPNPETQMPETQAPATPRNSGYIPSLDGWRAIAIVGVLMTHDRSWTFFGHSVSFLMGYGGYGVYLFFAISGFLITTRILEEEATVGRFHIGRFYIRRIFRIQPAAIAFLVAVALLALIGLDREGDTVSSWVASLLLYVNYIQHPGTSNLLTGHFWTLSVEEHFYILLSLLLFTIRRYRFMALALLFALSVALPEFLAHGTHAGWLSPVFTPRATQWQIAPLLLAALSAIVVRHPVAKRLVMRWLWPSAAFLVTLVFALAFHGFSLWRDGKAITLHHLDETFPFIAFYLLILWILATCFHPQSWTTRFLELSPLRFIGRISYSIYLWHILAFYLWAQLFFRSSAPFAAWSANPAFMWCQESMKYALVFLLATLSYYLVEKPMVRLGHRLAPSATQGRPELIGIPLESAVEAPSDPS